MRQKIIELELLKFKFFLKYLLSKSQWDPISYKNLNGNKHYGYKIVTY